MHAVVLAAGWGTRMGGSKGVCKALQPLHDGRVVLDWVVNSLNYPEITCFHVIHNHKWRDGFKRWKRTLRGDSGDRIPYVKLYDNWVDEPKSSVGAVADLLWIVKKAGLDTTFCLICGDTIVTANLQPFLRSYGGDPVMCIRRIKTGESVAELGKADIDDEGKILNFYEKSKAMTPWCWVGPVIMPSESKQLLETYLDDRHGQDDLGSFFSWLVVHYRVTEGDRAVRTWKIDEGTSIDVGTQEALLQARRAVT